MFIRKVSLKHIIVTIGIQNMLLDKKKKDFKNILFLYQKHMNYWGKKMRNNVIYLMRGTHIPKYYLEIIDLAEYAICHTKRR